MATMGAETKGDMECDITGMGLISVFIPIRSWSCERRGICVAEGSVLIWAVFSVCDLIPIKVNCYFSFKLKPKIIQYF